MAITISRNTRLLRSFRQPAEEELAKGLSYLPSGMWIFTDEVVGDVSGGNIDWVFGPPSAAEQQKYVYSVEGIGVHHSDTTSRPYEVLLNTREPLSNDAADDHRYIWTGSSVAGVTKSGWNLGRFSGAHSLGTAGPLTSLIWRPGDTAWVLEILTPNVNTLLFGVSAWGHFWDRKGLARGAIPVRP